MSNEKQEYLLLLRGGNNWYKELSPEELQKVMAKVGAWFESLNAKGIVKGGQPLGAEGRIITGKGNNLVVSDGPFAESKETIGGYTIILASSLDEATEIAKGCPLLSGGTVEVRPIAEECPMMAHAREVLGEKQLAGVGV
jgi:hypothetical protein